MIPAHPGVIPGHPAQRDPLRLYTVSVVFRARQVPGSGVFRTDVYAGSLILAGIQGELWLRAQPLSDIRIVSKFVDETHPTERTP